MQMAYVGNFTCGNTTQHSSDRIPEKKSPKKLPPGKMVFQKFYSTHKNVTVIFACKYRRILLSENEFVVEFWVFIDYVTLT